MQRAGRRWKWLESRGTKLVGQSSNRDRVNCRQFVALRPSLYSRELGAARSVIDHAVKIDSSRSKNEIEISFSLRL